jgi:phosphatidylserine decarboxylase
MGVSREPIEYFNRYTGRVETEEVYGEGFLRFAYENPLGRAALHTLVKRRWFSNWYGSRMSRPSSRDLIGPFVEQYDINEDEMAEPVDSFASFNDFFCRRLKRSARPVDPDPGTLVFPADGRHLLIPDTSQCDDFFIKGTRFDLGTLMGDPELAKRFANAAVLISRLCPVDYHRFHFPASGVTGGPVLINGPLYSVSPIALAKRPQLLWENKRYRTQLDSEAFGTVVLFEVGATCVGTVLHSHGSEEPVTKGEEKGCFRFGGSCFITVLASGVADFPEDLVEHSAQGLEVYAKMGDVCARRRS